MSQNGSEVPAKRFDLRDVLGLLGLGLIALGAWLIYPPAALIVVGALLLAVALLGARR